MFTHTYDSIITMENLLIAWVMFLRGKKHRKDVIRFQVELAKNLAELYTDLKNRTYIHDTYSSFNISDPKPRNIHKANVRDRVLHCLLSRELYWYFHPRFIYDSYSYRLGKGVHRGLDRFKYFARVVSKNHTRTCYGLKCDIKKFFANIDHSILGKIFERHIEDQEVRELIRKIVSSFHNSSPGIGLPLGNLTSQFFVNIYLHEFDMYIKQELQVKYYIRYTDDFVIFSENKKYLENLLPPIQTFLETKLKLKLHPNKVYIKTCASGFDFLGWIHFPYHRQIRTTAKRKIIKNLRGYPKKEVINSYRGLLRHGNTHKLQKRLKLDLI